MLSNGLYNEKIVRGFSATDGLRTFLLVPGDVSWTIYEKTHHKFKVDLVQENVSPEDLDEMIFDKEWSVADDGNGVYWYSQDMFHERMKLEMWNEG